MTMVLIVTLDRMLESRSSRPGSCAGSSTSAFAVASIITTTGFMTVDFDRWPELSRWLLVALMFIGGCAGSTAGGPKVIRVLVAWAAVIREVRLTFSPNAVVAVMVGNKPVPEDSIRAVMALIYLWVVAWLVGTALLAVGDVDLVTAATAAITTLSNVGPGARARGADREFRLLFRLADPRDGRADVARPARVLRDPRPRRSTLLASLRGDPTSRAVIRPSSPAVGPGFSPRAKRSPSVYHRAS
jgi:hypothetical protein